MVFSGRLYYRDFVSQNLILDSATGNSLGTFRASVAPAFNGSTGYFLNGVTLEAHDVTSGALLWSFAGDGSLTSAPIVDNGYIYIGSMSGNLYALDVTGSNVWTGKVGAAVQPPFRSIHSNL